MGGLRVMSYLALAILISHADGLRTYRDMFAHKHSVKFPPIPGWFPDSNPWDDYLYPPFGPHELLLRRKGKHVTVHLTSDSPAMQGSSITFTAALEYPKCQKEDANGELVYDEHCEDANGQVRLGYVFNQTSWLDDYGFGRCLDRSRCNVFPDGRPFPQSNDWRRKSYVYVWHTMGQYFETASGSSSSLTLNTSGVALGAGLMEVMVYRTRERRKYSPTAADHGIYFITDKIPLAVKLSQKQAENLTEGVFVRGADLVLNVMLHDPSEYLKTAAAVDYIWDFSDGNQLVTHSNVATHAYDHAGNVTVKLMVEAAFRMPCPPSPPTPNPTVPSGTHAVTGKVGPTAAATTATFPRTTAGVPMTTAGVPTTTTAKAMTTGCRDDGTPHDRSPAPHLTHAQLDLQPRPTECYRYLYGNFQREILIVGEGKLAVLSVQANKITDVSAATVTNTTVTFLVKCLGSAPSSACTIISDAPCRQVKSMVCEDVARGTGCEVTLRHTFLQPGSYCVNITLEGGASLALASTHVTIQPVFKGPQPVEVVLSAAAVLVAIFGFIAFTVYKRYKVYRPVRRSPAETEEGGVRLRFESLRSSLFPANEERSRLLNDRLPL
ncbi:LOW QUALITY PROTEIN: protein QNR-71 [Conger conger]|uniref:LOW QUALITY PROTEIN: protein QNR-71 n=1 Tax=Conger conger TaxID=82655 RepID=UPI002A59F04E|nr:LOW QUALITY PROTEIN: protein QNR-71 [Conger conger]